ncbi:LysR family transcriptional regulator [Niveibacterium sp. SC-1]|uniref:LysR family transcriptional regulator n=1 Tax=Niveibacterium sp. SC-1 TaxID=3135646 RepID=UPI00311E840D
MDASQRVRAMLSFTHAAELGGFAAAARVLGISAAAVSKNVAGLEGALGVRLMNRSTRALQLTPEGSNFLERAREALAALDAAVDSVAAEHGAPAGRVKFSTGVAFGQIFLVPLLSDFQARYPGIRLEIDFDDRRVDLVREGYDLGLRGGVLRDSSLISRHVCAMRQILVASPAYLAAQGVPRIPADLARHRLIGLRFLNGRHASWEFRDASGAIAEQAIAPGLVVSDSLAATEAAAIGLGITQVAAHHAWEHLQAGRLRVLLAGLHHPAPLDMAIQYPHRALLAARVRATIDYLIAAFAEERALHADAEALAPFCTDA